MTLTELLMFWRKRSAQQTESPAGATQDGGESDAVVDDRSRFEVAAVVLTDVGCLREANEDSVRFVRPGDDNIRARKGVLALVADGMGGHSAGEVASKMAAEVVPRIYYETEDPSGAALARGVREANRQIYEASLTDEHLQGMGTTCTALVLRNGSAFCAHVGDSRLYLVRRGEIYQMTQDQSEVMEMVRHGMISLEEARHHEDKNVILSAVGSRPEVDVSQWPSGFPVTDGDRFLLCSDGLHDLVSDSEMKDAIMGGDAHTACEGLIALAKERGGYDNISVAILAIRLAAQVAVAEVRQTREIAIAV